MATCPWGWAQCLAADPPAAAANDSGNVNLSEVLKQIGAGEGNIAELLDDLDGVPVKTAAEAEQICALLKSLPHPKGDKVPTRPVLDALMPLFQQVESAAAYDVLRSTGTPELERLFHAFAGSRDPHTHESLMMALKILAMYQTKQGTQCVVDAARKPFLPNNELWGVVLEQFDLKHPQAMEVIRQLSTPLPPGMIGVALLDTANELESEGNEFPHPLDTEAGVARLESWLASKKPEEYSYAVSAAATLPYLKRPERETLVKLALKHPDPEVQIEGAFASAEITSSGDGVQRLAKWCADPRYARKAMRYLEELDQAKAIPATAKDPKFQATAEMCDWLADPNEYGQPPDRIDLVDTRQLFWPPTGDKRAVWLFKYQYDASEPNQQPELGLGMVGSVTFALDGDNGPERMPLEMYALHCCWELQAAGDPRAPEQRSVEAGMKILTEKNPELVP
ncbi:MAG TPA: hypothetical protein VIK18_03620 [Pirellulales bacterium]